MESLKTTPLIKNQTAREQKTKKPTTERFLFRQRTTPGFISSKNSETIIFSTLMADKSSKNPNINEQDFERITTTIKKSKHSKTDN